MKIFKYLTPERIDVLRNQSLRFTQANYLNDPFEHLPFVSQFFDKEILQKIYNENLKPTLEQISYRKINEDDIVVGKQNCTKIGK